ncbi:MAG: YegS/Rv2252/BmrU family lipid kinase [Ruminococcus sp.]|nr:YegS/Rv2252/BmrU family lipid kinase [Ruminococcus sp.]
MHFDIVVNPAGASGKAWTLWEELKPLFDDADCEYTLYKSTLTEGIESICNKITKDKKGVRLVVIGGDGTLNEAVNGIADFSETMFGFIQCGTGNDMSRDMELPDDKKELAKRILDGTVNRCSDVGELVFEDNGKRRSRLFNISSDIGFGAASCEYVNNSKLKPFLNKIGLGKAAYLFGALKVCFTSKPGTVLVNYEGKTYKYKKCLAAIAMNHCYEGGGFKFCPDADFNDGKLDLCIGSGVSYPAFVRLLGLSKKGKHKGKKGITLHRSESFSMISDRPLYVHTDGEVQCKTKKVQVRLLPDKLQLML